MHSPKSYLYYLSGVIAFSLISWSCGGGGASPTATITGIAAQGGAIANGVVTIKDRNGIRFSGTTRADGKFSVAVPGGSPPFLLRISAKSDYLYGVAFATGYGNIHPFSDLIIRNWYKTRLSDVETEFDQIGVLDKQPTSLEIENNEKVIRNILSVQLANSGLSPASFNLINTPFVANHTGFDKVLDDTKVVIKAVQIKDVLINFSTARAAIVATDNATGLSGEMASLNLSQNLDRLDIELPSTPTNLLALPSTADKIILVWSESTDNVGVAGYNIYRDGVKVATSHLPVYRDAGLAENVQYCYKVESLDGYGNLSSIFSAESCSFTLSAADTVAPDTPAILARPTSSSQVQLSWAASLDNTGVIGYHVYRDGVKIAGTNLTNYTDSGLSENSQYCYVVRAIDAVLNVSIESNQVCVTTQPSILPRTLAGSCEITNAPDAICISYVGSYYSSAMMYAARAQSPCGFPNAGTNVWSTGYCQTNNAVGHCYNSVASAKSTDTYYYSPLRTGVTVSSLQANCELEGAWFDLP